MSKEKTDYSRTRRDFLQLASRVGLGLVYKIYFPAVFKEASPPLSLGNILLEDQSERLDVKWRNAQSMAKVQEAFLVMWARKRNTTPEEIRNQLSRGKRILESVIYPKLEASGLTTVMKDSVDLSNPARVVLWDKPEGSGRGNGQRLQFKVENNALTFFIYSSESIRSSRAAVSGVAESLVMILNDGVVISEDPYNVFPELKNLLFTFDNVGRYFPEIETTWY